MLHQLHQIRSCTPPKTLRVLLVGLGHEFGGAEVRMIMQARALQHKVGICRVAVLESSTLHRKLETEGIPCETLATNSLASPRLLLALYKIIRSQHYNVIDAHNIQSIFWGHLSAALAGAPGRVTTIHTNYKREYPGYKGIAYDSVLRLNRILARRYVTVTEALQAKSIVQGNTDRNTVIHNAIVMPSVPSRSRNTSMLAQWGFASGDFVVAIIGRLQPVKGHTFLIEAMSLLKDLPQVKVLVVGTGPLRAELEGQVKLAGLERQICFTGFREDISRILEAVDCLCIPSTWESFPYVMLEAAASARPILATAVGGMVTLLRNNETAVLVPPCDSPALAAAIRRFIADPDHANRIALAGYELVRKTLSIEEMITKTLRVYSQAVV